MYLNQDANACRMKEDADPPVQNNTRDSKNRFFASLRHEDSLKRSLRSTADADADAERKRKEKQKESRSEPREKRQKKHPPMLN